MTVQYLGNVKVKSGKGRKVVLGRTISEERGEGIEPVMVMGKFGRDYPYVSNERYARDLANVKLGEYLEVDFDPASGYMTIYQ